MARLFLALWPGPKAREAALAWQSAFDWPSGARLVAPEHLHVTLHFIGPVVRDRLPAIQSALARPCPHIALRFEGVELWHPGLAVLVAPSVPTPLQTLHAQLAEALHAAGLPVETRPYRPHVTLARQARGARLLAPVPPPLVWRAQAYVLVESRGGYRVLARYA